MDSVDQWADSLPPALEGRVALITKYLVFGIVSHPPPTVDIITP